MSPSHPPASPDLPRRQFLRRASLAAAAAAGTASSLVPGTLGAATAAQSSSSASGAQSRNPLRVAVIGVGNRGYASLSVAMRRVTITALCDVDEQTLALSLLHAADEGHPELLKVPRFKDYRAMFAKAAHTFDAVIVCTPDHHHYPASMLALKHGKHVFCEKPLTRSVAEARALRDAARTSKVVTQMGNQGHTTEGIRLVREWFELGLVGDVREVMAWGPAIGGKYFYRPKSLPPAPGEPEGSLNWDLWLGPAPKRDYAPIYQPLKWRGWWDFGNGTLGDWSAHTLDAPYWALQLGGPERVDVTLTEKPTEVVPETAIVTYRFPARGKLPPVKLTWYEGTAVRPKMPQGWDPSENLGSRGMIMIGSKGMIYHGGRPDSPRLMPLSLMEQVKRDRPKKWIPRVKGGPVEEWLAAILGEGPAPGSHFGYAAGLSQMALLGAVAMRAGVGFDWDETAGRITSDPALNRFIEIQARDGWRV